MNPTNLDQLVANSLPEGEILGASRRFVVGQQVLSAIREEYRIEPKGTPIKPEDVRKGDRVRIECADGDVVKRTALGPYASYLNDNFYLLDRPDPDAGFVFPYRDGAVVRMSPKSGMTSRTVASLERGDWYIAGYETASDEDNLREYWRDFEVLSDGSDR